MRTAGPPPPATRRPLALAVLAPGLGHAIRNPLFGVTATADARETRLSSSAERLACLRTLRGRAGRIEERWGEHLLRARPPRAAPVAVSPATLQAQALEACRDLAAARSDTVPAAPHGWPRPLEADREPIVPALRHAIAGALQRPTRDSRLEGELEEVAPGERAGVEWRILAEGPSFARQNLPRVFEPCPPSRPGGNGSRFAIVRTPMTAHGGRVRAGNRTEGGVRLVPWGPRAGGGSDG